MKFVTLPLVIVLATWLLSGSCSPAAPLNATYNAPGDVPLTASAYTATGNTVNFSLNCAPDTGTTLTVVKNTGLGFIDGTFGNLAQGQMVTLSFGGTDYKFVANYYGGSGNDLVLQWAATRPVGWGTNTSGQLGNGTTAASTVPVAVTTAGVLAGKTVTSVVTTVWHYALTARSPLGDLTIMASSARVAQWTATCRWRRAQRACSSARRSSLWPGEGIPVWRCARTERWQVGETILAASWATVARLPAMCRWR